MKRNLSERLSQLDVKEEYAIYALSQICKLGLDPTPEIYALWYSYYKNDDCDLKKRIDDIVTKNADIKTHHFESVLSDVRRDNTALREFHTDVSSVIDKTFENAGFLSQNTQNLGDYIYQISESTDKESTEILGEILKKTHVTLEMNNELTQKLFEQQNIVSELQQDYERVKSELITDSLTKVHNRRHLDDVLPRLIEKSNKNKSSLSVLMFDIDHFKKFNDTHGHQVGDTVLKFVGHTMLTLFKNNKANLFRYGGEEFAIIFENISRFEANKFAVQLMNTISKKEIILRDGGKNIGNVTISGGIAECGKRDDGAALIEKADLALYDSKRNGRNQMTISPF